MGEQISDRELVARVQQGDKKAFDLLVQKYQYRIAKLISRYVANPTEVLDVSQDAFIKAYRALPNFRGESAFYTWLYRIAINTAKNHLVVHGRRAADIAIDNEDSTLTESDLGLQEFDTPEDMLVKDEVQRTVIEAIDSLPEDLRTAITLREMEGLSYEEIAQAMDCPVGTVRSRIFRAREAIEDRLRALVGNSE